MRSRNAHFQRPCDRDHCDRGRAVTFAGPVAARPLDEVKAVGVRSASRSTSTNKPFSDADKDNKPFGINVDIANEIAKQLKVQPQIVLYQASEDMGGDFRLNLWKGDLVGSPLADLMLQVPNDRVLMLRDDQVFFTSPYFMEHLAYASRKDKVDRLETLNDIGTSKVAVEGTSASDLALMTAVGGRFRPNATHFPNFDKAAAAYQGRRDADPRRHRGCRSTTPSSNSRFNEEPTIPFSFPRSWGR